MKRFLSLLLPGAMILALLVPVAMAGGTSAVSPVEETPIPMEQEEPSPTPVELSQTSVQYARASNPSSYVRFEDLRKQLNKYNNNVKALNETISSLDHIDASDAVAPLEALLQSVNGALASLRSTETAAPELIQPLATSLTAEAALLTAQIQSVKSQISSGNDTMESTENTLNDSINQIVKGAESLYVGIITMESAANDVQNGIDSLNRAVALVEKQVELGMASSYDAESMRHQRSTVQSQLESLEYQIKTAKITLEGMLGMSLNGTVTLHPLSIPTAADVASVDYDAKLSSAMRRNVDVKNAALKDNGSDSADYTYQGARETFAYKFKLICLAVPEQQRLVDAAEETLAFQQRTLSIAAKKYQLGMLSHEEYLAAENDVRSASSSLFTAQLDLFTAYRNYEYACQYGIV